MTAFSNQSAVWDPVKNMYVNVTDVWTLVKKAFVNNNGVWTQFHAGNAFEVYSVGLEETQVTYGNAGLWINGAQVYTSGRSYNLVQFDQYGNILSAASYDLFADGANYAVAGSATNNLIAALNAIPVGRLYLLFSHDEPQTNASQIASALATLFGNTTTSILALGNPPYRGVYFLMGIAGQKPSIEEYLGTYVNSVSNPSAPSPQTDQGCADGAAVYTFRFFQDNYANLTQVYLGGNVTTNGTVSPVPAVSGLA